MPKNDPEVNEPKVLSAKQKKLVALMTPLVQEYYSDLKSVKEQEDVESALAAKVEDIQELLGAVLGEITIQQNQKMADAIAASEENPRP